MIFEHSTLETVRLLVNSPASYAARLARSQDEVRAAQALRFEVFNLELNEGLEQSYVSGLDEDPFDAVCDHLIIEHLPSQHQSGTRQLPRAEHQSEFTHAGLELPSSVSAALEPVPAGDFLLSTLDGRRIRLSEFRGKVVLINFWTTWCTACVGEMPELIELKKRHHEQLVILGISLDCIPNEDDDSNMGDRPSLNEIRKKVALTVEARQINYSILLDERNDTGARFNGGALTTTVIVDADGNVRRRFIGSRSLPVLEAMIAEASKQASRNR